LRRKFNSLANTLPRTGETEVPYEVSRALELREGIRRRCGSNDGEDYDLLEDFDENPHQGEDDFEVLEQQPSIQDLQQNDLEQQQNSVSNDLNIVGLPAMPNNPNVLVPPAVAAPLSVRRKHHKKWQT
jgi:hypothetical protein